MARLVVELVVLAYLTLTQRGLLSTMLAVAVRANEPLIAGVTYHALGVLVVVALGLTALTEQLEVGLQTPEVAVAEKVRILLRAPPAWVVLACA